MSGPAERPGDLDAAIGERVRHVRKAAGVTQEQLAGALGVTPTAVSYWENGKRSITPSTMVRVARALSVEVAALLPESWVRSAWFLVPPSPSPVESEGERELVTSEDGWTCMLQRVVIATSACTPDDPHDDCEEAAVLGQMPGRSTPAPVESGTVAVPAAEWEALVVEVKSPDREWVPNRITMAASRLVAAADRGQSR